MQALLSLVSAINWRQLGTLVGGVGALATGIGDAMVNRNLSPEDTALIIAGAAALGVHVHPASV